MKMAVKWALLWIACMIGFRHMVMAQSTGDSLQFTRRIIATGLEDPWNIVAGPDSHLWISEAKGYRVLRIEPVSGRKEVVLDLNSDRQFPRYDTIPDNIDGGKPWPQGGLMGLVLHPQFMNDKPYVYLAYVYKFDGAGQKGKGANAKDGGFYFMSRIMRFDYDSTVNKLRNPTIICDSIPSSNDHNGGRLIIATVDNRPYLFYSTGDMGAGQFANAARKNHAQDPSVFEGKILRFNVEPAQGKNVSRAWIPEDNPYGNAVWTLGHRNPQGLATLPWNGDTVIVAVEHGPFSDDEISIIEKGGNYGHPLVIGYADGNYNGLAAGTTDKDSLPGKWNTTYPLIADEKKNAAMLKNYKDPVLSLYPTSRDSLFAVMTSFVKGETKDKEWESLAPSGIAGYTASTIPGWKNSLLLTSLKHGTISRLSLEASTNKFVVAGSYFKAAARYRDVAVSADGTKIYVVTDKSQVTSGPSAANSKTSELAGAVLEFTWKPE